jgi:hypothetical protein
MDWKKYLIYHGRWQLSTVVMLGPITVFSWYFGPQVSLVLSQVIGAAVFYKVDQWIFTDNDE